jgi:hypothetical protein
MKTKYILLLRQISKTLNIHDFVMDIFWKLNHLGCETEYLKFKVSPELSDQVTAVIFTTGNSRFYTRCYDSVGSQSLRPKHINTIRDVTPFSKASQEGLDSVRTRFYISVDDDMILNKNCFKRLYYYISRENNCAEVIMRLKDPIIDRIYGIHIYNTEIIKQIGFHPLLAEKGCERQMQQKLNELGYFSEHIDLLAGSHNPVYTPEDAFWKYRFVGEQYIYYQSSSGNEILIKSINRLCEYWLSTQSTLALYAMAGLIDGMQSDNPSMQLDYKERDNEVTFDKLNAIFSKISVPSK